MQKASVEDNQEGLIIKHEDSDDEKDYRASFESAERRMLEIAPEILEQRRKKKLKLQILMFTLSYLSYMSIHIYREMWAFSKSTIIDEPEFDLTSSQLGNMDTAN